MARAPPCPSGASALTGWPASSWWRLLPVTTNNPSPHVATSTVRVMIGGSYSAPADEAITTRTGPIGARVPTNYSGSEIGIPTPVRVSVYRQKPCHFRCGFEHVGGKVCELAVRWNCCASHDANTRQLAIQLQHRQQLAGGDVVNRAVHDDDVRNYLLDS